MKMSNLPGDLVEEILTRVPLKSLRSVRLTCTKWNALSKSRSFTKMHLDREEAATRELGEYRMIMMKDYNVYLMSIVVNDNPSKEVEGKLTCLNNLEQIKISQVFQCEGLLLCILKEDNTKVMVWNPYLGQTRWIHTTDSYRGLDIWYTYRYAIGYEKKKNNSCPNHKILRFIDDGNFSQYEIYNFDSELWTTLDVTAHGTTPFSHSVCLKGNTYCCVVERNTYVDRILFFDFTKERFGPLLPLPFHVENIDNSDTMILSCVREEKLAALCDKFFKIEICITTKIDDNEVSWSNFLIVYLVEPPGLSISCGNFFIDEEKKVAMVLNRERFDRVTLEIFGELGYFGELDLGESTDNTCRRRLCSYAPSLVQIKQPE